MLCDIPYYKQEIEKAHPVTVMENVALGDL